MILNYKSGQFISTSCILNCSILFHSMQKATISSNYVDVYSRIQLNDSAINLLYFFWTHFFYLPLFFTLLLYLIHLFIHSVPKINIMCIAYIAIFLTYYAINSYHSLNITGAFLHNTSVFNLLLSNPINKYHPLLFYITSLAILLLCCKALQTNYIFTNNFFIKNNLTLIMLINYLLISTLYFGAWWALQEGSWGGWWNWDSSEVFGLVILTASLTLLHMVTVKNTLPIGYINYLYCLTIPLSYLFVQLNFDIISHNFGIREVSPINTGNYLTLSTIAIILYLKSLNIKIITSLTSITPLFSKRLTSRRIETNLNNLILTVLLFLLLLIYLPSFYPLINNVFWKCLQINLLNNLYAEYLIISFLWVTLLTLFATTRFILPILYLTSIVPKVLLPFTFIKPNKIMVLHFTTITLLLSALVYTTSVFIIHGTFGNAGVMQNIYTSFTPHYNTSYNNFTVTSETTYFVSNHLTDYVNDRVNVGLGDLPQSFLHLLYVDDLSQALNNGLMVYPYTVNVLEASSTQTNTILLVVMVGTLRYSQLKTKIIF